MTISVITVAYNSESTIFETLQSVASQTYPDVQHIVVDGGSTDRTNEIVSAATHNVTLVSRPPKGIFDAINEGIKIATGNLIAILHADDFYSSTTVLQQIAELFQADNELQGIYGDVRFVERVDITNTTRIYRGKSFANWQFRFGFMPPHPTFIVRRECYEKWGLYKADYRDSADFDLLLRFMLRNKMNVKYIPLEMVTMREGGLSTATLSQRLAQNKEILRSCRENNLATSTPLLWLRYPIKIWQFLPSLFTTKQK